MHAGINTSFINTLYTYTSDKHFKGDGVIAERISKS